MAQPIASLGKMNLDDPRYQRMVQQLGSMGQHQSAIFNTSMADSKWAANRAGLGLDWYRMGLEKEMFDKSHDLKRRGLRHERWLNQKKMKMGKQALSDQKTGLMWDVGLGLAKMPLHYAAGKRETTRRKEQGNLLAKQNKLLDLQIKSYGKGGGGAAGGGMSFSGPSMGKTFGGNMSSAGSLTGSSGGFGAGYRWAPKY